MTTGALNFTNNGAIAFEQTQSVNGFASPVTLGFQGTGGAINTFAPLLQDPGTGQNLLGVEIENGGTWKLTNANTYSGGTTVAGSNLIVANISGSATGSGPVVIEDSLASTAGILGGGGSIGGPVTIQSGNTIEPSLGVTGGANNLTINNTLNLNAGADLIYDLNTPSSPGIGGGNDLTTVTGAVTLNPNLTLGVYPQAGFGAGTYELLHYGSSIDNTGNFTGWTANLQSAPSALGAGQFEVFTFQNDTAHNNVNLVVSNSASAPTLGVNQSSATVQPLGTTMDYSNVSNPIVSILGGPGGNTGTGGNTNTNFYVARGQQPSAKPISFAWSTSPYQLAPGTGFFVPSGVQVGNPSVGSIVSPNAPYSGTSPYNPSGSGQYSINGTVVGAIYPAGTNPSPSGPTTDNWLPAAVLAPTIVVSSPSNAIPPGPFPVYYGESFVNPNHLSGVCLADLQSNGTYAFPGAGMSGIGADDQFNYQGSFLSLVQTDFPTITALSQLTETQWLDFGGSFGVDTTNNIAWTVTDLYSADFTVIAVGSYVPEPASLGLIGAAGVALLTRRRGRGSRKN